MASEEEAAGETPEEEEAAAPADDAEAAPAAAAAATEVVVGNVFTGARVATLSAAAGETAKTIKARLASEMGVPCGKLRLVLDGDALGDGWLVPPGAGRLNLGLGIVQRTEPEHLEPLALVEGNYWSTSATPFDDGEFLRDLLLKDPSAELAAVRLTHREGSVSGIACSYRTRDGLVDAPPHDQPGYGWYAGRGEDAPAVTLELAPEERIVRVEARAGEVLDRLELHTDRGQSAVAGGRGGSARRVELEPGCHVFGFSGHRNGGTVVRLGFHVM